MAAEEAPTVMPFWGRAVIAPSPVDEHQTKTGLIVPHKYDGGDGFERGVLLAVGQDDTNAAPLEPGMVVYYRRGVRILEVVVVDLQDILAYEA